MPTTTRSTISSPGLPARLLNTMPTDIKASAVRITRRRPSRSASGAISIPPIAMPSSPALNSRPITSPPMPHSACRRGAMNDRIVTSTPSAMLIAKHSAMIATPRGVHAAAAAPPGETPAISSRLVLSLVQVLMQARTDRRWAHRATRPAARYPAVPTQARMMSATCCARRSTAAVLVISTPKLCAKVNWLDTL